MDRNDPWNKIQVAKKTLVLYIVRAVVLIFVLSTFQC